MSNDVTLFAAGMQNLPAHLQGVEIDEATRKLAGVGGGLRISIKGGVWRMLNDGEEIQRNEDRALNVVVVASSPDTARTYYEGKWVEGESSPPVCWSLNGVAPEPTSPKPQSTKCVTCPAEHRRVGGWRFACLPLLTQSGRHAGERCGRQGVQDSIACAVLVWED